METLVQPIGTPPQNADTPVVEEERKGEGGELIVDGCEANDR